ncbi:MAG: TetR/AcrR family transcriptional regulator [Candidatus Abyssobacteria bacterium SURF_17]|uniref:TetR/AcrR family transcriptional regulator n=1 Tax=Candidatus Abyssobacteria bacterium SURF_17 TaxID=2093361 RepID=A0A419EPC8_9BACT|nr:MAG: TetR/AcrR family transcriptional regulator [Candidatus Abyssubacteria bacterium SURF_17]
MPRKTYARHKGSDKREREIIEAGLACFAEHGYANTTLEDIRLRSGASNGSIYHYFASKEGLAAAIYVEAIADYQKRILDAIERNPQARAGVRAIVRAHLDWVEENPDWARYLMEMRHAPFMATAESAIAEHNREFINAFVTWLNPHLKSGEIRRMGPDIFISLLLGPCQEFVRNWLGGCTQTKLSAAKEELASAAWLVVRGPATAEN